MDVIVLLLDIQEKLYNCFANPDDNYWGTQVEIINDARYACYYFDNEEQMLGSNLIQPDYKEDKTLFSKITSLSHKK